jgi:hypothetical protein
LPISPAFDRIKREIEPFGEVALIILDTSAALGIGPVYASGEHLRCDRG